MNFSSRTAVITGAASGIGAETAKAFAESGADLVLLDINEEGLQSLHESIKKFHIRINTFVVDVTDFDAVQLVGQKINKIYDKIDILANIAGGGVDGQKPISELSKESWDKLIYLNLGSVFNCTKMVIKQMIEQRSGKIINISSVAGVRGGPQLAKGGYATAKAGVIGLTQTLARELGSYGILVNVIAPGLHLTPGTTSNNSEAMQSIINNLPLKKAGDSSKLAQLILFLASDDNQYYNRRSDMCRRWIVHALREIFK